MTIVSLAARRRANLRPVPEAENEFTNAAIGTMSAPQTQPAGRHAPDLSEPAPNDLPAPRSADADEPVRVQGKFFFAGERKHFVKGVTYGPFAPETHGAQFPEHTTVEHDFALMRGAGANTVRVFTVPPVWLLDLAATAGLKVLSGCPGRSMSRFSTARSSGPRSAPPSRPGCAPAPGTGRSSPISSAMRSRPT
jgi:hypothetical protein